MKYYTGIGSRNTPKEIQELMIEFSIVLERLGYLLRSGGADGADIVFEKKVKPINKYIYLPWKGFNNNPSLFYELCDKAKVIAEKHHPGWKYLSEPVHKLMTRNVYQVLGPKLNKSSEFVICWTPDGCEDIKDRTNKTGGTGQAISIANEYNVRVYNLFNQSSLDELNQLIKRIS